jgi:hypothetical protein
MLWPMRSAICSGRVGVRLAGEKRALIGKA